MRFMLILLLAGAMLPTMWSCKTSEANYRAAYELARQKDTAGVDSTVYSRIRSEERPQTVVAGGDTLAMKTEYVRLTDGCGGTAEGFRPYNVVIARFKQLFNAKSVRSRAIEAGYKDAFIVQTREPLYYVVAVSCATTAEARKALADVTKRQPVVMRDPCPFILRKR